VTAEGGGAEALIANRTAIGIWEQFDQLDAGNGNVSLRAHANSKYVTAGSNSLIADSTTVGTAQTFTVVHNSNGSVSLRALANNQYVDRGERRSQGTHRQPHGDRSLGGVRPHHRLGGDRVGHYLLGHYLLGGTGHDGRCRRVGASTPLLAVPQAGLPRRVRTASRVVDHLWAGGRFR